MAFYRQAMTFDELEEAKATLIDVYLKQAEQRDDALARAEKAEAAQLATQFARDAALALLRRIVVSIRLGSIDEAAVREAGRIVGEEGGV